MDGGGLLAQVHACAMRLALCVIIHGSGAFCCARSRLTVSTNANRRVRSSTACLVGLFPVPSGLQAGEDWERDAKQQKATTVNGTHPRRCALPTLRGAPTGAPPFALCATRAIKSIDMNGAHPWRCALRREGLHHQRVEEACRAAVGDRLSVRCCSGTPPSGGNPQSRSRSPGERAANRPRSMTGLAQETAHRKPARSSQAGARRTYHRFATRWWGDEARPEPSAEPSLLAERSRGS